MPHAQTYHVDVFSQELELVCGSFEVSARPKAEQLAGVVCARQCGGLDIAQIGIDAQKVTRSRRNIKHDPGDHFFLILQHQGSANILQSDTETCLNPGDMCIVDSTLPSRFQFEQGYSAQVSVHLPRNEMVNRFGRRIEGGIEIPKDDPLGLALRSILSKIVTDESLTNNQMREAFFSVLGAYLTERTKGSRTINPDREIIQRCIALMSENFSDPEFTSSAAAELTGVSLRRLQRAFTLIDETPHSRLQALRIEHAFDAICNRMKGKRDATVSSIAFDSGFNDLSTFYRCFKARYSTSPTARYEEAAGPRTN